MSGSRAGSGSGSGSGSGAGGDLMVAIKALWNSRTVPCNG